MHPSLNDETSTTIYLSNGNIILARAAADERLINRGIIQFSRLIIVGNNRLTVTST
ncbi:MAG: hypothetical protein WB988_11105 [Candidatus Nitrosopolaris sp.]